VISGSIQYRNYLEDISALYHLEKAYETEMRKAEQAGDAEYNEARRRQQMFQGKWQDFETRLNKICVQLEKLRSRIDFQLTETGSTGLLLRDAGDVESALREIAGDIEHCEQSLAWIERNSV